MSGPVLTLRSIAPCDGSALTEVENFLSWSAEYYPGIEAWWRRRVVPNLGAERVCHLAFVDDELAGVCIGKLNVKSTKLCTLRVRESHRGFGLGELLLSRVAADANRAGSTSMHFTISEPVDAECGSYFRNLGFLNVGWASRRYPRAGDEHIYTTSMSRLINGLNRKIRHADWCTEQKRIG